MDGKITISANTLDEAITKALIELQTTSEHLHYEVVQKESAGLLGIFGKKPCIIRAHVMSEAEEKELAEAKKLEGIQCRPLQRIVSKSSKIPAGSLAARCSLERESRCCHRKSWRDVPASNTDAGKCEQHCQWE